MQTIILECMRAKSFQSCLFVTLCTVACQASLFMGILQARILEWVALPSSRGSSQPRDRAQSPILLVDSLPSELPGTLHRNRLIKEEAFLALKCHESCEVEASVKGIS